MNQPNLALWLALLGFLALPQGAKAEPQPVIIAISNFDFVDTSDEVRDQQQVHAARLDVFMHTLREAIEKDGKYRLVALAGDKADEMGDARKAGVKRLVTGGIHKMSTLVMWMKAGAFDVETGKPIFDRLFTFRSDTDDGWRRAAMFLVEELEVLPGQ
jgi:hypothetical protein